VLEATTLLAIMIEPLVPAALLEDLHATVSSSHGPSRRVRP
jgi:hypothetical protein